MPASLAASLAALGIAVGCSGGRTATPPTPKLDAEGAVEANELVLDGIDLSDADSSLAATRAVFRKRKGGGGFFTYHDLRESVLSDAHLEIRASSGRFSLSPVIDYAKDVSSLIVRMGAARGRSQTLSRLLFTDLAIRIEYAGSGNLEMTAKKARFTLDSRALVLEDAVTVTPPSGKELAAPIAVLADGHDGIYFPRGYWLDAPPKEKCRVSVVYSPELGALQELRRVCGSTPTYRSTFFTPSARGTLLAAPTIPAIEYEDPIDTREQIVLTELLDRLPPEWKPLLMGILSAESAVTFKPPDPSPRRDSERRERGLAPSAASPSQSAAPRQAPEGSGR